MSHAKQTDLSAQCRRLAGCRGRKRALVAVGHTLLVIIYEILKRRTTYRERGADYLDRLDADRVTGGLVRRLERMGHKVTIEPQAQA